MTDTSREGAHHSGAASHLQGLQRERDTAVRHLQAILNPQSTQTQAWQAKQAARAWLIRNTGVAHA